MNLEIAYEIEFVNSNRIEGKINCINGEDISSIKRKIIGFEGLKN